MQGGRLPRLHSETPSLKPKDWDGHVMVECLPSMCKALAPSLVSEERKLVLTSPANS